jgi:TRAP-type C4-dicarboxylate transport system permease small subunit
MRRLVGLSTWGADELSNYALAISASWTFAYALLVKAHIRIDLVTSRLSGHGRAFLNLLALLAIGYLAWGFAQAFFHIFMRSWGRGTTSITTLQTPLWIPQGLFLMGIIFFIAVTILLIVRLLVAVFVERDFKVADRVAGALTVAEETEEAVSDALHTHQRNG